MEEDFLRRARALGIALDDQDTGSMVRLERFNPTETSQGQLFHRIQKAVADGARALW